jgi:hypothetical protein
VARQETVALPEPLVILAGIAAPQVRPGGTELVRLTVPAKPFRALMVIVEFAETPTLTGAGGVALIVKSVKLKTAVAL